MGESACLRRSFSHPSDASRGAAQPAPGDPIRALTESVSFGRFVSESLAWEKWSAFSHNRYLEEVEKFSKPGSVAQKKAYFEAHYKKKAATSQIEEVGEPNFGVPRQEDIHTPGDESTGESESAQADTVDAHDVNQKKESTEAMVASSGDENESNPINERSKLEMAEVASPEDVKRELAEKHLSPSEDCSPFDNPEFTAKSMTSQNKNVPDKVPIDQQILSTCEKKQALSSSKSSTQSRAPRLPPPHTKAIMSVQPRGPRHVNNADSSSQTQTVRSSVKENRLSSKSLHMSINFASLGGSSSKFCPQFLRVRKNAECTAPSKIEKDNSVARKAQTQACLRKSVCSAITPASQDRSSSKCSSINGSKARLTTVCSPFSFRSEERAAKRKEKQEEKNTAMKAEVQPLQTHKCTIPRPSKLESQPTPDRCLNTRSRPSQRIKVNAESSNNVNRKLSHSTTNHRTFLPRKNVQENASPNIQV